MKTNRLGVVMFLILSMASCHRASPTSPSSGGGNSVAVTLAALTVSGANSIKGPNQVTQLRAVAKYSDGSTQDQTSAATWSSSNNLVATVTSGGLVTAVGFGTVDITASLQNVEGRLSITVVPLTIEFTAISQGACGSATFQKDGATFYSKPGCTLNGGRGFNVAAIDRATGDLLEPVQNFDTWYSGPSAARAMIDSLARQPNGTLLLIAVGDEAGLTVGATYGCPRDPPPGSACCQPLGGDLEKLRRTLEGLGASQIRQYCYWNSYSLITIKGVGAQAEQLEHVAQAISRHTLTIQ